MIRLFVALPLPVETRNHLQMLTGGLPGAKWVSPENFHLTLRFVGEVENGQADDIDLALSRIDAPGFSINLEGLDWFGTRTRVSTVVVRAERCEPLMHLQRKIESALVRTGLEPEERKFSPHITLARMRAGRPAEVQAYCDERAMFKDGPIDMDRFVLCSSFLSQSGAIHQPEREYTLGA